MDNATYQRIDEITQRVLAGGKASAVEGSGSLICTTIICPG